MFQENSTHSHTKLFPQSIDIEEQKIKSMSVKFMIQMTHLNKN